MNVVDPSNGLVNPTLANAIFEESAHLAYSIFPSLADEAIGRRRARIFDQRFFFRPRRCALRIARLRDWDRRTLGVEDTLSIYMSDERTFQDERFLQMGHLVHEDNHLVVSIMQAPLINFSQTHGPRINDIEPRSFRVFHSYVCQARVP